MTAPTVVTVAPVSYCQRRAGTRQTAKAEKDAARNTVEAIAPDSKGNLETTPLQGCMRFIYLWAKQKRCPYRIPCGRSLPSRSAVRMLSSFPSPDPIDFQPSCLPSSTRTETRLTPDTKRVRRGILRVVVLGFDQRKEDGGSIIAY